MPDDNRTSKLILGTAAASLAALGIVFVASNVELPTVARDEVQKIEKIEKVEKLEKLEHIEVSPPSPPPPAPAPPPVHPHPAPSR